MFEAISGLDSEAVSFPKTITDAMIVACWLDIPYLWVDALCIQQDDYADKAKIIANMGAIYSNADLTIVASTNRNPSEGLPGVTSVHRSQEQIVERFQGIQLAVAFHDPRKPLSDVETSVWNTRGWTYQERQLSQRVVYFTDTEMCFTCPHTTYYEGTYPSSDNKIKPLPVDEFTGPFADPQELWFKIWTDPGQAHFVNKAFQTDDGIVTMVGEDLDLNNGPPPVSAPVYEHKKIPNTDTSGMLQIRGQNTWNIYRQAVAAYTQRQLSSDSDAVAAFEGMAELVRQGAPINFWYNLPDSAFEQALLWYPQRPLQRRKAGGRDMFPSWSWAAWKGAVYYRGRGWYNGLYRAPGTAVKWLCKLEAKQWLQKHGSDQLVGRPSRSVLQEGQAIADREEYTYLEQVNPHEWYRLRYDEWGWKTIIDPDRNQHAYTHEQYPGVHFNYPIMLPGQESIRLPDDEGVLYFQAQSARVRFCDMKTTTPIKEAGVESFVQIGLQDEQRSANYRPPWRRILYHQGYRVGSLVLNIPFEDLDLETDNLYKLIAMSRDEEPRVAPPRETWPVYRALGPVEIQRHVGYENQYVQEGLKISLPNEDAEPETGLWTESGDAHWDRGRFEGVIYPLYNVLLVKREEEIFSQRVGVGKIHHHAFHHAQADQDVIRLK